MDKNFIKETMLSLEGPRLVNRDLRPETFSHAACGWPAGCQCIVHRASCTSRGVQSRSSFTRTFRTHYGTAPSNYRSEAKRVFVAY
jgi:hypothetical protein